MSGNKASKYLTHSIISLSEANPNLRQIREFTVDLVTRRRNSDLHPATAITITSAL